MCNGLHLVKILTVLLGVLWLAGCSVVTMQAPLSAPAEPADRCRLEGVWRGADRQPLWVRFATNGVAHIVGVEWNQAGAAFSLKQMEAVVTHGERSRFLSLRGPKEGQGEDDYLLLEYMLNEPEYLLIWLPDVPEFRAAIEAGPLQGEVKGDSITLTTPPEALLRFLDDPAQVRLFDYRNPIVLERLSGADGNSCR